MGCYRVSPTAVGMTTRAAVAASPSRSRTRGKLYVCDTRLERLAQDLQDMAAELGPFIHEEHAMVR
jgi:hypothetical protein